MRARRCTGRAILDYVGIKRFDAAGKVCGEHRFLGLFTSTAYGAKPADIPLLRRKTANVVARSGVARGSHAGKALLNILYSYPRDELFQTSEDELLRTAVGILQSRRTPALSSLRSPRCVRALPHLHDLRAARKLHDQAAREVAGDPAEGVQRHELGVQRPALGVGAGARARHGPHPARADPGVRRARARGAPRRRGAPLGGRPQGRAGRYARRSQRQPAVRSIRRRAARRLSRGLHRARSGARHRNDGEAFRRESAGHEPLSAAGGRARNAALQALPSRRAGNSVGQPADARAHGTQGHRRASAPRVASRTCGDLAARLRHADDAARRRPRRA